MKVFHKDKLISKPFKPYNKEELNYIIKCLNENPNIHVSEILFGILMNINQNTKLTNTQIKKIRYIYLKGDDISKSQLYEFNENDVSKWFVSRIKIHFNKRKRKKVNYDENGNEIL